MAALTVSPNPAPPSTVVSVAGSSFANAKTRLLLDGAGATTNIFRPRRDGSFNVGITVGAQVQTQTLVAQQASGGTWIEAARTTISVQAVTPPPSGTVWTAPASLTTQQLQNAYADMSIDGIQLAPTHQLSTATSGDGPVCRDNGIDRTSRPLTIYPAPGGTTFRGAPGVVYYDGQFFWTGKAITMAPGITFADYILNQTGLHNIQGTTGLRLLGQTMQRITLGPDTAPYKTWFAYIAGSTNTNLLIDGVTAIGTNKTWSLIQEDSTTSPQTGIVLRNITGSDLDFGFYENVPTTGLVLDTWNLTNVGHSGTAIAFHQAQGTYHAINRVNSGVIAINGSRMVSV